MTVRAEKRGFCRIYYIYNMNRKSLAPQEGVSRKIAKKLK